MAPVVRVDNEVWTWLQSKATPFEDTPNTVLRRIAGFQVVARSRRDSSVGPTKAQGGGQSDGRSSLLRPFVQTLTKVVARQGGSVSTWDGGTARKTSNIVRITAGARRPPTLLYIKTRSESAGFWGLRKNQLDALRAAGAKWLVALLIGPGEKGYVLSPDLVDRAIKDHRWSFGQAGDFKVHENHEIAGSKQFNDWKSLSDSLVA